ncbi:MAG: helix-turn-helix domain-containing protein [Halodesulfovibrio sp.]
MPNQHHPHAHRAPQHGDNRYRQYAPCPQLAAYVLCYWSMGTHAQPDTALEIVGQTPQKNDGMTRNISGRVAKDDEYGPQHLPRVRVVPDGCLDAVFDPQGVIAPLGMRSSGPGVMLSGIMQQGTVIGFTGPGTVFGIRFRPAGAGVFLNLHLQETAGLRLDIADVLPELAARLEDTLLVAPQGMQAVVCHMEQALLQRLPNIRPSSDSSATFANSATFASSAKFNNFGISDLPRAAVSLMAQTGGTLDIATAASHLGISTRQLERSFAHHVGLSPKQFCRILRLHKALGLLRANPAVVCWSHVAAECGFADQSHLVREMQSLFGLTPSALQREHEHVAFIQYAMPDLR